MSKWGKSYFLYLILILILLTGCNKTNKNLENYLITGTDIDVEAKEMMPSIDELPTYKQIDYRHTQKNGIIYESNSVILVVTYDQATFRSEKERIIEEIVSQSNKYVTINSYKLYGVEGNGYPKSFGTIGISDKLQRIAYLYFYDPDLDRIGESNDRKEISTFIKNNFNYDF